MTTHIKGKIHKEKGQAASSTRSLTSFYNPEVTQRLIEAETRWALFVAEHNIAFLSSDHATKLFPKMFSDSEIGKRFACGRTKTTAIVKTALAPHFQDIAVQNMKCNPFSIMMDESNDKTDKSCIILIRVLDTEKGDICTRFLDMPWHSRKSFRCPQNILGKKRIRFLKSSGIHVRHHQRHERGKIWCPEAHQECTLNLVRCWVYLPSS